MHTILQMQVRSCSLCSYHENVENVIWVNSVNFLLFLCVYKAVHRAAVLQMEKTFVSFLSGAERKATVAHIQPRGKWGRYWVSLLLWKWSTFRELNSKTLTQPFYCWFLWSVSLDLFAIEVCRCVVRLSCLCLFLAKVLLWDDSNGENPVLCSIRATEDIVMNMKSVIHHWW